MKVQCKRYTDDVISEDENIKIMETDARQCAMRHACYASCPFHAIGAVCHPFDVIESIYETNCAHESLIMTVKKEIYSDSEPPTWFVLFTKPHASTYQ